MNVTKLYEKMQQNQDIYDFFTDLNSHLIEIKSTSEELNFSDIDHRQEKHFWTSLDKFKTTCQEIQNQAKERFVDYEEKLYNEKK